MQGKRVVIAGGSGFLGVSLAHHLTGLGCQVAILSRHAPKAPGSWTHVPWDARTLGPWMSALDGAAGLVNLVGRTVDCVKTPDHCDEILRSRVEATRVLGAAMARVSSPPRAWVQMSTAHIYGDPPSLRCDEDSPTGFGLAPIVGRAWEEAFRESLPAGVRGVVLRTSFVVGRDRGAGAGALAKLVPLARAGLGGRVASGRQGMSWIHELDMNRLFERGLRDESMDGTYVASSPNPVTQFDFMRELRRVAGGLGALGLALPAFEWMVRIGAPLVLRTDPELAIYGRFVVSRRLREEGFEFKFPTLRGALEDALARSR
jgi:uncharacterized protein (TIGR01777 family)